MTDESYNAECRTGVYPPATAVTVVIKTYAEQNGQTSQNYFTSLFPKLKDTMLSKDVRKKALLLSIT